MSGVSQPYNSTLPVEDAGAGTLEAVRRCMGDTLEGCERVGVAFSGGVDSSLLAKVCSEHAGVTLLTVGFEPSHDMEYSALAAPRLRLPHHTRAIPDEELGRAYRIVDGAIPPGRPLSWHENCIAFHFVAGLAAGLGLERVVAANGIDELFCGYDSYRRIYDSGEEAINEMMRQKTANEIQMAGVMRGVAGRQGVLIEQPLLGGSFVEFSGMVPLHEKITGSGDYLRKHAVRRAAALAGLPPDICLKRKKALQYGTRIHPRLLRTIRRL